MLTLRSLVADSHADNMSSDCGQKAEKLFSSWKLLICQKSQFEYVYERQNNENIDCNDIDILFFYGSIFLVDLGHFSVP
jgi:hypothetical protein